MAAAVAQLLADTPRINILINNAGVGSVGSVVDASPEDWEKVFAVNVFGTARVTRLLHPLLVRGKNSVIVNTCSVASTTGIPRRAVYAASKGALETLTRA